MNQEVMEQIAKRLNLIYSHGAVIFTRKGADDVAWDYASNEDRQQAIIEARALLDDVPTIKSALELWERIPDGKYCVDCLFAGWRDTGIEQFPLCFLERIDIPRQKSGVMAIKCSGCPRPYKEKK